VNIEENKNATSFENEPLLNIFQPSMRWYYTFIPLAKWFAGVGLIMRSLAIILIMTSDPVGSEAMANLIETPFFIIAAILIIKAAKYFELFHQKALWYLRAHLVFHLAVDTLSLLVIVVLAVTDSFEASAEFLILDIIVPLLFDYLWYLNYTYFKKRGFLLTNTGPKPIKPEFCRRCGSELSEHRKCTGCGQQYFSLHRILKEKPVIPTLLAVVATVFLVLSISLNARVQELNTQLEEMQATIAEQRQEINSQKTELAILSATKRSLEKQRDRAYKEYESYIRNVNALIDEILPKATFMDENIALVTENGTKYHRLNCHHIQNADVFYIYTVKQAEWNGYQPCKECHE